MVLKSEASCPKCFTQEQMYSKLSFDWQNSKFWCPRNSMHLFQEGESGFLESVERTRF